MRMWRVAEKYGDWKKSRASERGGGRVNEKCASRRKVGRVKENSKIEGQVNDKRDRDGRRVREGGRVKDK